MKKRLTKLSETQASLLITGTICVLLLLVSLIFLFKGQPGWTIGFAIGTVVDFIYIWLVGVGASASLNEGKTGLFLLVYFLRMVLFVGIFALLVILQYIVKVETLFNSCWAMLIAFVPTTFVTIAVQLMNKGKNNGQVQ